MNTREDVAISGEVQVSGNGASFIGALISADALPLTEVSYMLDKPWKWQDEYAIWKAAGKPTDSTDPGWSAFVEGIEA